MIDKLTQTNNLNKFLACLGIFTLSLGFGSGVANVGQALNLNTENLSLVANSFYSNFAQLTPQQKIDFEKDLSSDQSREITEEQKKGILDFLRGSDSSTNRSTTEIKVATTSTTKETNSLVVVNLASKAGLKPGTAGSPGHCSTQTTSRSASCCLAKNLDALGRCPNFGGRTPTPFYAVDGDDSSDSLWCSQKTFTSGNDWIYVDLGDKADIDAVKITFADGTSSGGKYACTRATDYQIQTSNDKTTWTNQVTIKGNNKNVVSHTFAGQPTARYVRLLTTKVLDNGGWRLGVREFEVEGTSYAPEVDVKVNGQDDPLALPANSTAEITWATANVFGCKASGGWSGDKGPSGTESTGEVFEANKTYTLTCNKPGGGTITDSVAVKFGNLGDSRVRVNLTARVLPAYSTGATPAAVETKEEPVQKRGFFAPVTEFFRNLFNQATEHVFAEEGEEEPSASLSADQAELPSFGSPVELTWSSNGDPGEPTDRCTLSLVNPETHEGIVGNLNQGVFPQVLGQSEGLGSGSSVYPGGPNGSVTISALGETTLLPPGKTTIKVSCNIKGLDPDRPTASLTAFDYVDIVSPQRCEVGFANIISNLNGSYLSFITEDGFSEWDDVSQSARVGVFITDAYDASGGKNDIADSMAHSQHCYLIDASAGLIEIEDIGNPYLDSVKESTDRGLAVHFTFAIVSGPQAGQGHAVIALDVQKSGFFEKTYVVKALDPNGPSLIDLTFTKANEPITLPIPGEEPFVGRVHIAQYAGGSVLPFSVDTNSYSLPSDTAYCRTSLNPNQEYCSRIPADWLAAGNYPDIDNFASGSSAGVCKGWSNFVLAVAYNGVFVGECSAPRI